ncbi:hypothetical protein TRFO_31779 [Tritrichomonas foetus]|uniref:F5/8 type C domain-containing protein n=1 Tax=Tritrichomonas foetus TaxID=1144522 RepID=A0A1J4JSP4_9EUKA|nr:hypothetical protein TRFO_31779 [Tritrichomonas foetus]|eukprot:OHT01448.1 hypothetical protein TRFO_31779 [Tritrichomonas foetus]
MTITSQKNLCEIFIQSEKFHLPSIFFQKFPKYMQVQILLSSFGLRNITPVKFENDFRFIVGNNYYECPKILACFISPKISKLLSQDITLSEYTIKHNDENLEFRQIIDLLNGSPLLLENEETNDYLMQIAVQLGNDEIIQKIMNSSEGLNISNAIQRIIFLSSNNMDFKNEINFIAYHFDQFSKESLKSIGLENLELILSSPSLSLFSEDSLFEFIRFLGEEYFSLLKFLQIEYLSPLSIEKLLEIINLDNLTSQLWLSICNRLKLGVTPNTNMFRHYNKFVLNSEYPFDGILSTFSEKFNGNVHLNNIIKITASSDPEQKVHFVADSEWDSYWYSENEPDSWIQFDFQNYLITLTDYTIQSDGSDGNHLMRWAIEGSNDGFIWEILDNRITQDLDGFYIIKTYSVNTRKAFRYIRLKQTGKNSSFQDFLLISNLEFFGSIIHNTENLS